MMRRFATLALIAVMLGAAPSAFAQGSGGGSSSGGSGSSGSGAGGRSDGVGNTPGSPTPGSPGQNSPGGSSSQTAPGASPGTPGRTRTTGPIDNSAQAATALQAHGYSNVQGLVRSGDVYRGRAIRDGRTVMIEMDARTGTVRETSG